MDNMNLRLEKAITTTILYTFSSYKTRNISERKESKQNLGSKYQKKKVERKV